MDSNYEFVATDARGKREPLFFLQDRCFYYRNASVSLVTYFKCSHASCSARGTLRNGIFKNTGIAHNHEDDSNKYDFLKMYSKLKVFAIESEGDISQRLDEVLMKVSQ